jgi:hypothetical protein
MSCEPTLLPEPNHVMLNHLYALSIKDGVMVLRDQFYETPFRAGKVFGQFFLAIRDKISSKNNIKNYAVTLHT